MEKGISYRDFLNQVEERLLDFMPEKYRKHHIRIEELEIFDSHVEILGVLSKETHIAPGLDLREYFKEFLSYWNIDKVLEQIAEDYEKLATEIGDDYMPTYDEFLEYIENNILSFMPQEYANHKVESFEVTKQNGHIYRGFTLVSSEKGMNCCPAIYCEDFYKMFLDTQDITTTMKVIAANYVKADSMGRSLKFPNLDNFSEVKSLIGYSVVNAEFSKEMLKDVIHKIEGDFAKVYRVFHFREEDCCSAKLTKEILESWNISMSELEQIADENMGVLFPAVIRSSGEILDMFGEFEKGVVPFSERPHAMYCLTNEHRAHGAATMFYPGMLETIRDLVQDDYYILPSSADEVMIVSRETNSARAFGELVRSANKIFVQPQDVIADCIYEYKRETGCISKVPESVRMMDRQKGRDR